MEWLMYFRFLPNTNKSMMMMMMILALAKLSQFNGAAVFALSTHENKGF